MMIALIVAVLLAAFLAGIAVHQRVMLREARFEISAYQDGEVETAKNTGDLRAQVRAHETSLTMMLSEGKRNRRQEYVLNLVRSERTRQDDMYGRVHAVLEMGFGGSVPATPWLLPFNGADNGRVEAVFRGDYERYENTHGLPTWMHIIREEVAELFDTHTPSETIEEAVQVAALCVSLCEQQLAKQEGDHQ